MAAHKYQNKQLLAILLFVGLLVAVYMSSALSGSFSFAHLVATYPSIPGWVVTYIQGIANIASAIGVVTAILVSLGLAAIASVAIQYIKTYGVRYGIAL